MLRFKNNNKLWKTITLGLALVFMFSNLGSSIYAMESDNSEKHSSAEAYLFFTLGAIKSNLGYDKGTTYFWPEGRMIKGRVTSAKFDFSKLETGNHHIANGDERISDIRLSIEGESFPLDKLNVSKIRGAIINAIGTKTEIKNINADQAKEVVIDINDADLVYSFMRISKHGDAIHVDINIKKAGEELKDEAKTEEENSEADKPKDADENAGGKDAEKESNGTESNNAAGEGTDKEDNAADKEGNKPSDSEDKKSQDENKAENGSDKVEGKEEQNKDSQSKPEKKEETNKETTESYSSGSTSSSSYEGSTGSANTNTKVEDKKEEPKVEEVVIEEELAPLGSLNYNDNFAYIQGYLNNTVRPNSVVTRQEAAAIFYRLMDVNFRNTIKAEENNFSDVTAAMWSNKHISTLANGKILNGYEDGTFQPERAITRAELAVLVVKFDKLNENASHNFVDLKGHWAEKQIAAATEKGWISGYPNGEVRPDKAITRAEFVTLVNKVLGRSVKRAEVPVGVKQFVDLTPDAWYYEAMVTATNSYLADRGNDGYQKWTKLIDPEIEM